MSVAQKVLDLIPENPPLAVAAYDGSRAGPDRRAGRGRGALAARLPAPGHRARRARPRPAPTSPASSTSRATSSPSSRSRTGLDGLRIRPAQVLRWPCGSSGSRSSSRSRRHPRRRACAAAATAQRARRGRDRAPLRRVERLLPARPRPVDDVLVRGVERPDHERSRRRRPTSTSSSAPSSAWSPGMRLLDVGCGWGGMVLHAAQHHGVTRRRRHALAASRPSSPPKRVGRGRARRPRRDPLPGLPRHRRRPVRRDQLDRHVRARRPGPARAPTSARCTALLRARGPPAEPRDQPPGRPAAATRSPGASARSPGGHRGRLVVDLEHRQSSSTATSSPTASCTRSGTVVSAIQEAASRSRHVESLREHYALTLRRWVRQPRGRLGRGGAPRSARRRARVWRLYMAGVRPSASRRPDADPPGARPCATTGAAAACRCGPDFESTPASPIG